MPFQQIRLHVFAGGSPRGLSPTGLHPLEQSSLRETQANRQ